MFRVFVKMLNEPNQYLYHAFAENQKAADILVEAITADMIEKFPEGIFQVISEVVHLHNDSEIDRLKDYLHQFKKADELFQKAMSVEEKQTFDEKNGFEIQSVVTITGTAKLKESSKKERDSTLRNMKNCLYWHC